jgi:hypothetical protein
MKESRGKVVELTNREDMDYQADYEDIQPASSGTNNYTLLPDLSLYIPANPQ